MTEQDIILQLTLETVIRRLRPKVTRETTDEEWRRACDQAIAEIEVEYETLRRVVGGGAEN